MNATNRCLEARRIEDALRVSEELGGAEPRAARLLRAQALEAAGRAVDAAVIRGAVRH